MTQVSPRCVRAVLFVLTVAGLALASPYARASPAAASAEGSEHDFDFVLGRWDFVAESKLPNTPATYTGRWTGERVGDGALVEDDYMPGEVGARQYLGVTIRAFDAKTKRWTTTFVAPPAAAWALGSAWRDGKDMAEGPLDPAKGRRARFSDIAPDHFVWTLDSSIDGGRTWTTMVRVHSRRAAS